MATRRTLKPKLNQPLAKGGILKPALSNASWLEKELRKLILPMIEETERELKALFDSPAADVLEDGTVATQDESFTDKADSIMRKLSGKYESIFNVMGPTIASEFVYRGDKHAKATLKGSLSDISSSISINHEKMTPALKNTLEASVQQTVGLIKRVPQDYLGQLQGDVMRAITTGSGLEDVQTALADRKVAVKNWVHNTSLDQTRKVYNTTTAKRAQAVGLQRFEWVHVGGSVHPREYHKRAASAGGLNGGIYSFDDPPIIDEKTGMRGLPGDAINCHCTMRPIVEFNTGE